jgi:hypothetical protein
MNIWKNAVRRNFTFNVSGRVLTLNDLWKLDCYKKEHENKNKITLDDLYRNIQESIPTNTGLIKSTETNDVKNKRLKLEIIKDVFDTKTREVAERAKMQELKVRQNKTAELMSDAVIRKMSKLSLKELEEFANSGLDEIEFLKNLESKKK